MKLLSNSAWRVIEELIADQRMEAKRDRERIDRLTEALARKEQVPLMMPQATRVAVYPFGQAGSPHIPEPSSGWYDTVPPKPLATQDRQNRQNLGGTTS